MTLGGSLLSVRLLELSPDPWFKKQLKENLRDIILHTQIHNLLKWHVVIGGKNIKPR